MASDDTSHDFELFRYDPSTAAAAIFVVLFFVVTTLHTYQLFRTRTWYFIPFVLGGYFEWVGYVGRVASAEQTPDWTLGPYIVQALLLLVAPALFAASIYMELGKIIVVTDGEKHSLIRRKWLTKIFVIGDIVSFLVQGGGAGIQAQKTLSSYNSGEKIIIVGLVVQLVFFGCFVIVTSIFHVRMRKNPTHAVLSGSNPWQRHLFTLYAGSALILIRSIFRLIEYSQGNGGYLISHEVFLYVFDGVLMLATMSIFAWIHPSEVNALIKGSGGKVMKHAVKLETIV